MTLWASHYRMARSCIVALCTLVFATASLFGQFGGIQIPGRGRNPGGRGQQSPNGSQSTAKAVGPTETLTGTLRDIASSSLTLDAGDDRIILVQIQSGTKYLSTMDKVKASDFEAGDHVTVEATRDSDDHYFSKTITMNKKGSAEDKAAARQAASNLPSLDNRNSDNRGADSRSGSASTASAPPSDDSDPDRPRLRRSGSDSAATTAQTSSDSPRAATESTATKNDTPAPRPASGPSAMSGPGSDRSVGSSTTSVRRPGVSPGASSGPSVAVADDSGPPVLRRSSPAPGRAPVEQSASSDNTTPDTPRVRPSLSAEDANGTTRLPDVPPPGTGPDNSPGARGVYNNGDPIIEQARDAAFTFSESLPNYVVRQITNRYASSSAKNGRASWQPLDIVTTDLVYEDGKERYTNVMVNGKPTKYIEQTGSWSEGEFASMLQAILAPATNADFRNQKAVTIANRTAWKYDYTVEQLRSSWTLHADGQTVSPSYTGSVWIDKSTYRVLRIEIAARDLPRNFPLDSAESSIDYGFVTIGTQNVLLPAAADSLSCTRSAPDCTRNHTEFHNYKKYGADSSITFDDAPAK